VVEFISSRSAQQTTKESGSLLDVHGVEFMEGEIQKNFLWFVRLSSPGASGWR
jgi:hypothetical protein